MRMKSNWFDREFGPRTGRQTVTAVGSPAMSWFDRVATNMAPRWQLKRLRARMAADLIVRNYEGAAVGRRTQGWRRSSTDANQAVGPFIGRLRDVARDLVRNNPYAESGLSTIVDHTVGWGIVPKSQPKNQRAAALWKQWAETTECDADGRNDFAGLEKLVMRTVVESGEVLVRRRLRLPEDGFSIPMQLQVLEPDFLDISKDSLGGLDGGRRIIQGVEFDILGRRIAYWLFPEHPGSAFGVNASVRVPAANVLHIFKPMRPGQVRGASWFAPVLLRFKDFDEFEDATLMKQKIAACLAVITSDVDGSGTPLGTNDSSTSPEIDSLEPGMILNVPAGRSVSVVDPPTVREYSDYTKTTLRSIATGLGVTYEDLTGDYADMPFSAARMSRLRHWARVEDWRWRMLIPQFCNPSWNWAMEVAAIFGLKDPPTAEWTAPPAPMIDPVNEGLAYQRNIRAGIMSFSEALRERGYDPEDVMTEIAADFEKLDELGLILDSDPRQMTQAGQLQGKALPKTAAAPAPAAAVNEADAAARQLRLASGERR
jgi:lambda family phage portal protein